MRSWRAGRSWDSRLSCLLLLLHLELALLHFLQQLLRCLHARLVSQSRLFGLGRALVGAVIRCAIICRFGFGSLRRIDGRRRSSVGGGGCIPRSRSVRCLGDQYHPHQSVGVCRRSEQDVIEA